MKYVQPMVLLIAGAFACKPAPTTDGQDPQTKLTLELVDSLVVNELEPLVIDDYLEGSGKFLLRGNKSRKPHLVAETGEIVQVFDVLHDGPNGMGSGAFGYGFLNADQWVAQGLFNGYHVYDLAGNKLQLLDPIHLDIFSMSMYSYRTFFRGFTTNGKRMLVGQEQNLFDPGSLTEEERQSAVYYDRAKTVFSYEVDSSKLRLLETYPEEWKPRKEGKMLGPSPPIVAYHRGRQELALLPTLGDQLFVYDYASGRPLLKYQVDLRHRFRPEGLPEQVGDYSSYPAFTDLRYVGKKLLVEFKTRIPEDIVTQLRAASEYRYDSPLFKEAMATYIKPYYMVVAGGKQVGVLDGLPLSGALDFADENGYIYVNDNLDPAVERDYNVFYRLKFKE